MKLLFILLVIFQFKHLFADYFLQGEYMLGKFKPDWSFLKPLLAHVGVHAAMTFAIAACLVGGVQLEHDIYIGPLTIAALFGLGDATIHFFMDRIKASPKYMGRWKPLTGEQWVDLKFQANCIDVDKQHDIIRANAKKRLRSNVFFWWALGIDQMVHHLTHYGIIYLIVLFH